MRLAIDHDTTYRFSAGIAHGLQRLRLTPVAGPGQTIGQWTLDLDGARREVDYVDEHGNHVTLISLVPGVDSVMIRVHGVAETTDVAGVVGRHQGFLPLWHFARPTELTAPGPRLAALVGTLDGLGDDTLTRLHSLSELVRDTVDYAPGQTAVDTTVEDVLAAKAGVCQDHAHVFIAAARSLGIPARYVSGYLLMTDRVEQDAGHGWAEVYVDGLGWVGFDVANAICPDARYVRLATGRDYREAAPVTGIGYGTQGETMQVTLAVAEQAVTS